MKQTWVMATECSEHPTGCLHVIGQWSFSSTDDYKPRKMVFVAGDCEGRPDLPLKVWRVEEED